MRFKSFFYELQRRHVFKAGVAYLVVSWLIVQVLSILIPAFRISPQLLQISIIIMMIVFPVWLLINWFYDITEEGIVRVQNEKVESVQISKKSVNLNKVIIITLSVIVALLLFNTFRLSKENKVTETEEASILPDFQSSVAVLAFADMSPEHDKEYLADGMSEEILNRLAKCKDLKVIGRTSSFSYKNKDVTHEVIGEELDVAYILEGSVRQSGDIFRITAQLIDVSDGSHIWSDTFDRTMEDALAVQDEIASIVAKRLEVALLNDDIREHKIDPEAYELYLKANHEAFKLRKEAMLKADSLIRKSLKLDNTYSPSWVLLAHVIYSKAFDYFLLDPEIAMESGQLAAQNAIEIDSTNPMSYYWQSKFMWQARNMEQANKFIRKAVNMAQNDPRILERAGDFALRVNKIKDAESYFERAIVLDPRTWVANFRMAFVKWFQEDYEAAEGYLQRVYSYGFPDYNKNFEMALINRDKGDLKKAIEWMERESDPYLRILLECSIQHSLGQEAKAKEILEEIKAMTFEETGSENIDSNPEHDYEIARLYAHMKERDSAFIYLDKAYEHVLNWPQFLFTTPDFKNIKEDPRWEAYLNRMGKDFEYDFLNHEQ